MDIPFPTLYTPNKGFDEQFENFLFFILIFSFCKEKFRI